MNFAGATYYDKKKNDLVTKKNKDNRSWLRRGAFEDVYLGEDEDITREEPRWLMQILTRMAQQAGGELDLWELKEVLEKKAKKERR